jgi:GTP-binding protein EngB required for normal cell division
MTRITSNTNMDVDNDSDTTLPPDPVTAPLLYIAAEAQQLIATINKLSTLGIEDHEIQLPKIAVAGDQSTGKSSIVESLT